MSNQKLIVWIAPNLNHYKVKILNRLAKRNIDLLVVSGVSDTQLGHDASDVPRFFRFVNILVVKAGFAKNIHTYRVLLNVIRNERPSWVVMPIEVKHITIIFFLLFLRLIYQFQLVSVNHPIKSDRDNWFARFIKRFLFNLYNKIIFYTEKGLITSVANGDIATKKGFYANNALDINLSDTALEPHLNLSEVSRPPGILFIGRLIPAKRICVLLHYFEKLKKLIPRLKLYMIGDGPDRNIVMEAQSANAAIVSLGSLTNELEIGKIFSLVDIVFVPGESGLAINHSFAYGKPFITIGDGVSHGPEIDYLEDDVNGLLLGSDFDKNIDRITTLLTNSEKLSRFQEAAYVKAKEISANAWCDSIENAIYSS